MVSVPRRKNLVPAILLALSVAVPGTARAANILFAHVASYAPYVGDGNALAGYLTTAGHTVTTRFLDLAVYNDYGSFDQVWVYDLYAGTDSSATQNANYANIAAWFNALSLADQNLITDGRIISSGPAWVAGGEPAWIQNYAAQLEARGGGMVLGTDHAPDYTRGINTINAAIGINPFTGFYFTPPFEAFVDSASPLWVSGLKACSFAPSEDCINDNSSTSFAPTGLQPNGRFLTPVAYHGSVTSAFNLAAVSSTIGSVTFPDPSVVPEPGSMVLLGSGLVLVAVRLRRRRA